MKTYYKVVCPSPGGLLSAIVHHTRYFSKRYIPGTWTKAKIGGLLVFKTLEQARRMADDENGIFQIWTCAGKYPVKLPKFRLWNCRRFSLKYLEKTWGAGLCMLLDDYHTWPKGSVSFRQVKLLEKVDF